MGKRRVLQASVSTLAVAALAVTAAGCGGSSSASPPATTTAATTTTTSTTTTTTTGGAAGARGGAFAADFQAYTSCLKAKGVTVPSFTRRPGSTNRTFTGPRPTSTNRTFTNRTSTNRRPGAGFGFGQAGAKLTAKQRAAMTACRSKLPSGGRFTPGGRAGGGPSGGGSGGGGGGAPGNFSKYTACLAKHGVKFGGATQNQAKFAAAQAACRSQLTAPAPTTTTSG